MRKLVFGINITADGYCGHTDMIADEEMHNYFTEILRNSDLMLYGRVTVQLMVPYWPEIAKAQTESDATNDFARVFDALDKIVFSTTMNDAEGERTRVVRTNLAEEVRVLKQMPGKDICVGSLSIASQLSESGLIDEYRFVVHPVIAGNGPRLFSSLKSSDRPQLELVDSTTFQSGVIALHYTNRS